MRRSIALLLLPIAVLAFVLLGAIALLACGGDGDDESAPTATSAVPTATEAASAPAGATNFSVVADATAGFV